MERERSQELYDLYDLAWSAYETLGGEAPDTTRLEQEAQSLNINLAEKRHQLHIEYLGDYQGY
jgi:hypothetical protein